MTVRNEERRTGRGGYKIGGEEELRRGERRE
jgi:hypothetical protein